MTDPVVPVELQPRPVMQDGELKVMSPSPTPGEPQAQRRREDQPGAYTVEWAVLLLAVLGWAGTFLSDMSKEATFQSVWTPRFMGEHLAQLVTYVVSVVAAKRIR